MMDHFQRNTMGDAAKTPKTTDADIFVAKGVHRDFALSCPITAT